MKLKSVRFIHNVRLPNGSISSHATVESDYQRISYIELVPNFVLVHREHKTTAIPLSNVAHCESIEEPAIGLFLENPPEGHSSEEAEQGKGKNTKTARGRKKKASVL